MKKRARAAFAGMPQRVEMVMGNLLEGRAHDKPEGRRLPTNGRRRSRPSPSSVVVARPGFPRGEGGYPVSKPRKRVDRSLIIGES
jgi:hypothetical protein